MPHPHPALAIHTHFASLKDFRIDRSRLHHFMDIITIAILAVICGAEGWLDIAAYGHAKYDWLKTIVVGSLFAKEGIW